MAEGLKREEGKGTGQKREQKKVRRKKREKDRTKRSKYQKDTETTGKRETKKGLFWEEHVVGFKWEGDKHLSRSYRFFTIYPTENDLKTGLGKQKNEPAIRQSQKGIIYP